jgi:hypothetical protein
VDTRSVGRRPIGEERARSMAKQANVGRKSRFWIRTSGASNSCLCKSSSACFFFLPLFCAVTNHRKMSTASSERSNRRPQLSLIRTQAAQALVPARDLRQATNFAWGIEPRIAPGQRGPTPTSCQMCRKLRSKCFRRNGGRLGEEACVGCRRRGRSPLSQHE